MIRIGDQYSLSIKIDNEVYDLDRSAFHSLDIYEGVTEAVPSIMLQLKDNREKTEENPIHDASKVEISLSVLTEEEKEEEWIPFRVNKISVVESRGMDILQFSAYYDAPNYLKLSRFEAISGPSFAVAEEMASQSNLQVETDNSDDSQVWIRPGMTGYNFLSDVARHAYSDNNSAYAFCVTRKGVLRYYNIGERRKKRRPVWKFVQLDDNYSNLNKDSVLFYDGFPTVQSGIFNRFISYGALINDYDLVTGNSETFQVESLQKSTKSLQINPELLGMTRFRYSPISVGNTHENYNQALLQNLTILGTFSSNYTLITTRPKDVNLLDVVQLQAVIKDTKESRRSVNGLYFVDRIVTKLSATDVTVTYNLVREGVNLEDDSLL